MGIEASAQDIIILRYSAPLFLGFIWDRCSLVLFFGGLPVDRNLCMAHSLTAHCKELHEQGLSVDVLLT